MRSRLVAMEYKTYHRPELFSPTPPLEAVKMMIAKLAEVGGGDEANPWSVMHVDVSRAYFHAPCHKPTYIEIPEEDRGEHDHDKIGKLRVSLYGTREAQVNWEKTYVDVLIAAGFKRGVANPCAFYLKEHNLRVIVHGDDFLATGREMALHWLRRTLAAKFEIKAAIVGPAKHQEKSLTMLNRTLRWTPKGMEWIPDNRHIEETIKTMGLNNANGVAAPAEESINEIGVNRGDQIPIQPEEVKMFRGLAARCNYLSSDRADINFSARAVSEGMANPNMRDMKHMRHLGRYLKRTADMYYLYEWGQRVNGIIVQSDSDWAGDKASRKSTIGGAAYLGPYLLKAWSKKQSQVALSSGEAELYAANRGAIEGMGIQSLGRDMGIDMELLVQIDAEAAKGILERRGLGRTRHIEVQDLWAQEAIRQGRFKVQKVASKENTGDLGTKPLPREDNERLLQIMGYHSRGCEEGRGRWE